MHSAIRAIVIVELFRAKASSVYGSARKKASKKQADIMIPARVSCSSLKCARLRFLEL